jgi:lysophospholipase L1-like esterase
MKTNLQQVYITLVLFFVSIQLLKAQTMVTINASDPNIQYTGRTIITDPNNVIFANPGVSIKATFQGTAINAIFSDFNSSNGASTTTYFNVIIDGGTPSSISLTAAQTIYPLATGLTDASHTIELFKRTETSVGKVAFKGFQLVTGKTLLTPAPLPSRRIEFIGDSQTCGYGNESSANPPVSGFTAVNENNYKAWGAITARNLNAQYSCVAYSGRGLYRNNTGAMTGTLPLMYDQTILDDATVSWDNKRYTPDVIVINLGTNDFAAEVANTAYTVTESTFGGAYSSFLTKLRGYYPNAKIICAVGVMMSDYYPSGGLHWTRIQQYVKNVVTAKNTGGDANVFYYMMSPQSAPYGEDWHPTAATDLAMATGLTSYINSVATWNSCPVTLNLGSDINLTGKTYPITLDSKSKANTGVTYRWYHNDVLIANASLAVYQIASSTGAAGTYKVVRDSASCSAQSQLTASTTPVPVGRIANWDYNKKAAVVLTFDDWSNGHPKIVVPELKSRNMIATFFVNSGNCTWADVKIAAANGNEIANHTKTHVYANSSNYVSEVLDCKTAIETNITTQKVTTFAYPFGSNDPSLIAYLKSTGHIAARVVSPGNYTYNFATSIDDYFKIMTYSMDGTVTLPTFNTQLQTVINGGGLLTFLYHSVNSPTVVDNNYAIVPQSNFQAQMDAVMARKSETWITTFSQAVKYHREKNCASLVEVQPADGLQWIVNLTDTLTDNVTYNQPLYLQLKLNGGKYDQITQNGIPLAIEYQANDSIMFHAVPNGGTITLKASSGISLTASATPSSVTNSGGTIVNFTATATATTPNTLTQVVLNLTSLGGSSAVVMASAGANSYQYSYTVPAGLTIGNKSVDVTASDNAVPAHTRISTLVIAVGNGIVITSATVNPSTVTNNVSNNLAFNVNATASGTVAGITIDLSSIGGGSASAMTSAGSNNYTLNYVLAANTVAGTKVLPVTVTDNLGNKKTTTISLTVNPNYTYLDIYTDPSTMICSNCFWTGGTSDVVVEQTNKGAIEGIKDYKFSYTVVSYWAGMGFNLNNWVTGATKDFSSYDSLQISYNGPFTAGTGINVSFIGLNNVKSSPKSLTASTAYKTVKIGLKEFGTFDLSKITQLGIDITGAASGAGTLFIDNIRLIKTTSPIITSNVIVNSNVVSQMAYPNPFSQAINFRVNTQENLNLNIRILNVLGQELYESTSFKTNETILLGKDLVPGFYVIEATVNGQKLMTRICKQ